MQLGMHFQDGNDHNRRTVDIYEIGMATLRQRGFSPGTLVASGWKC